MSGAFGLSDVAYVGAVGSVAAFDPNAQAYITAVETADGQALEAAVRTAINDFVVGCKADGIWNAIKALCIMAGARTLNGALQPLVGTAPTRFGTEDGWDYNRKTGLRGNGTNNYLNSNRNNNAESQDNNHNSCYITQASSQTTVNMVMGGPGSGAGANNLGHNGTNALFMRSRSNTSTQQAGAAPVQFYGISRAAAPNFVYRINGGSRTVSLPSDGLASSNIGVFCRGVDAAASFHTNARVAFYSIGEALDLALLDVRVTALVNSFAAAIP